MKKEKTVRTYQRRTKSGKVVTVKQHKAKYNASDKVKKTAKKKGAGEELEEKKKVKKPVQLEFSFEEDLKNTPEQDNQDSVKKVKETAKKESTKKPTEKKSYSVKEIRSAAKYVMKYSQPSMKSKADPEKLRRAQQIVEQEIPKDKNGKRNLSSYINSGFSDISTDNKPGIKRKVRPVGSGTNGPEPKKKKSEKASTPASSEPAFTAADFKEWYHGTGSAGDKKVAKYLREKLGRSEYKKLENEAIDNYSARGHSVMFKRLFPETTKALKKSSYKESVRVGNSDEDNYSSRRSGIPGPRKKEPAEKKTVRRPYSYGPSAPYEGDSQIRHELANWRVSPTSASGKASRENLTKLIKRKKSLGYSLSKREESFLD